MKYVLYILLIAAIFGLVALVDFVIGRLFPKKEIQKTGNTVRLPRYSSILGLMMTLLALFALLFLDLSENTALAVGCVVVLIMGIFLLVNFWRFGIWYDEEKFVYRTLTKREKTYYYKDITGQQAILAKSGVNTTLFVGGDALELYESMQGLGNFLSKAFYAWCRIKEIDPDTVENNPQMLVYFPEQP